MRKLTNAQIKTILDGTMLVFDPSSGGKNNATGEYSLAGWASFTKGKLMESGTLSSDKGDKAVRLRSIFEVLNSEFEPHDIVVQEDIGTVLGHQTLLNACGVYIVGTKSKQYYEANIRAWQSFAKQLGGWVKGDESDAIYMGLYMIAYASGWNARSKLADKQVIINHVRRLRDEREYTPEDL